MVVPECTPQANNARDSGGAFSSVLPSVNGPVIEEVSPPAPQPSAEECKAQGNAAIRTGDLEGAVGHYSAGLRAPDAIADAAALLYSNRALCLHKLGRHEE